MVENCSQNMLFDLGKMSEEKYAASLGTRTKQTVLNIYDYFLKHVKSTEIRFHILSVW